MYPTIYINGYFLLQNVGGIQRFAINILHELDHLLSENPVKLNFICLVPDIVSIRYKNISIQVIKPLINKQTFFEQITLPLYTRQKFLVNLCHLAPIVKRNQLVVVHDTLYLYFKDNHSKVSKFIIKNIPYVARYLAAVSNLIKSDINNKLKINKHIEIIHNSAEHLLPISEEKDFVSKINLDQYQYILSVSSQPNAVHKNTKILLDLSLKYNLKIALVGSDNILDHGGKLIYLGNISNDSILKNLYANAKCFVFPSFYESFGIPPLEAMMCGCPVIVSDFIGFHDIYGDAAIYFNPHDVNSLHDAIEKLNDENVRNNLIQKGFERVKLYSWKDSANKLLEIIVKINGHT